MIRHSDAAIMENRPWEAIPTNLHSPDHEAESVHDGVVVGIDIGSCYPIVVIFLI